MSPERLLALAVDALDAPDLPAPVRVRAAALVGRQAVEAALAAAWRRQGVPEAALRQANAREQLLALGALDPAIERETHLVWWQFTRACHHRAYEVTPAPAAMRLGLKDARAVVDALATLGG